MTNQRTYQPQDRIVSSLIRMLESGLNWSNPKLANLFTYSNLSPRYTQRGFAGSAVILNWLSYGQNPAPYGGRCGYFWVALVSHGTLYSIPPNLAYFLSRPARLAWLVASFYGFFSGAEPHTVLRAYLLRPQAVGVVEFLGVRVADVCCRTTSRLARF